METILHIVLKFQFDGACFQRREARANFGVSNTASPMHARLMLKIVASSFKGVFSFDDF